jgi:hypothetical protein
MFLCKLYPSRHQQTFKTTPTQRIIIASIVCLLGGGGRAREEPAQCTRCMHGPPVGGGGGGMAKVFWAGGRWLGGGGRAWPQAGDTPPSVSGIYQH